MPFFLYFFIIFKTKIIRNLFLSKSFSLVIYTFFNLFLYFLKNKVEISFRITFLKLSFYKILIHNSNQINMKNKLLKKLILPVFLLIGSFIYAQSVTGTVSDTSGPLPGVNILVKGTTTGTQTDFDGNYTLDNVPSDAVIVYSFIGYKTQEISVSGQSVINILMEEDTSVLDEVIVIGYGTTTIKDATGAVAVVTSDDFNRGIISSPEQLIQGKTAGVQITQTSGEPGAGINIRIRGSNSVRSNNNPLFVVDGIPLSGGNTSASNNVAGVGSNPAKNPLNFLNPNDIESISILKDASATAIYGSRGANGVIIITTKSGKSGKGLFEYSTSLSISKPRETYNLLSASEFLSESARLGYNVSDRDLGSQTNWQNVIYRTSTSHNQFLTYSKNYGDGSYRATFGYGKQFGIVEKSDLERITSRLNINHKFLDDKLRFNLQSTYSRINDQTPPIAGSAGFRGDLLGAAYSANPTWSSDPDFSFGGSLINPANLLAYTQGTTNTRRFLGSLSTEYDFTNELTGKVNLGYDRSNSKNYNVSSAKVNTLQGTSGDGRGEYNELDVENTLLEITLNYKKEFEKSDLEILVGFSYQKFDNFGINATGWGFGTNNLDAMGKDLQAVVEGIAGDIEGSYQQFGYADNLPGIYVNRLFPDPVSEFITSGTPKTVRSLSVDTYDFFTELQSYFGRVNYIIINKYLFTATIRADGSSSFSEDNRYGYFPSGAIAWKIAEEDFMADSSISTLKLRVSAGLTGNQEGVGYGNYVRRERWGGVGPNDGGDINLLGGVGAVAFANPDLKWESTLQYAAGLDFGFNNDRFTGSIDVYRKETKDLLFLINTAQPAVNPSQFKNLDDSKIINEGIEFYFGYDIVQSEDFNFNMNFNIAYNDNMVESLQGEYTAGAINGPGLSGAFAQKLQEGHPIFSYYMLVFSGYDSGGQPIHSEDKEFVGKSALPDLTGGLSFNLDYKNWAFSLYFNGQFGHYIYNNTANAFFTAGAFNTTRNVLPSTLTSGEDLGASADVSTRFLEKGDFVRLQNLSVSYNMPLSGDGVFKSMVFSVTGQNLFVITDYSGLDPEVSTRTSTEGLPALGIDYGAYPTPKTFTFGINVKF